MTSFIDRRFSQIPNVLSPVGQLPQFLLHTPNSNQVKLLLCYCCYLPASSPRLQGSSLQNSTGDMPRTNLAADVLQVTSQSTRFATDAVETPASKDVLIKGLSISVNQRELLDNAEVHIKENCRYVLVGRNGEGKSSRLLAPGELTEQSILTKSSTAQSDSGEASSIHSMGIAYSTAWTDI